MTGLYVLNVLYAACKGIDSSVKLGRWMLVCRIMLIRYYSNSCMRMFSSKIVSLLSLFTMFKDNNDMFTI